MAMKNEAYYRDLLARSLDEELNGEEQAELEQELQRSLRLREEAVQYDQIREAFRSVKQPVDEAFTERVMQKAEQAVTVHLPARWLHLAVAASVAIILLTGASIYWSEGSFSTDALVGVSELAPEDAVTLLQAY